MDLFFNRKNIIILAIFILIVAGASYFGIWPFSQKILVLYKTNKELSANISKIDKEVANLKKASATIKSEKTDYDAIINFLPTEKNDDFVNQTESLAINTGNTLQSIKFIEDDKTGLKILGVTERKYELKIAGKFPSIYNFLEGLNRLNQYNNVYGMTIEASVATETSETEVTATLTGAIYNRYVTTTDKTSSGDQNGAK